MIGELKSQTSMNESPVFPVVLSVLQKGQEGSCDVSTDCIYHSDISLLKDHHMHSDGLGSNIHVSSPISGRGCFLSLLSFCFFFYSPSQRQKQIHPIYPGRRETRKHLIIDPL